MALYGRWKVGAGGFIGEVSLVDPPSWVVSRYAVLVPLYELTDLYVHPLRRGRGWAHALLEAVCQESERKEFDMWLRPKPYGHNAPMSTAELQLLYKSYGFKTVPKRQRVTDTLEMWRRYDGAK